MSYLTDLKKDLDERKRGLVTEALKLIREDAPKNKFSILCGCLREIEATESRISQLEKREP